MSLVFLQVKLNFVNHPFLTFSIASNAGIDTESLKKAIKLFQYRFGLEVNGEFDSSTLSLMSQPRCGDKGNVINSSEKGEFCVQAILLDHIIFLWLNYLNIRIISIFKTSIYTRAMIQKLL